MRSVNGLLLGCTQEELAEMLLTMCEEARHMYESDYSADYSFPREKIAQFYREAKAVTAAEQAETKAVALSKLTNKEKILLGLVNK